MAQRLPFLLDKTKIKPALSNAQEKQVVSQVAANVNDRLSLLTSVLKSPKAKSYKQTSGVSSVDKTVLSLTTSMSVIASSLKRINESLSKISKITFPSITPLSAPEKGKDKAKDEKKEEGAGSLLKQLITNPAVLAIIGGIGYALLPKEMRDKVNKTLGAFAQGFSDAVGESEDRGLKGFKAAVITVGTLFATYFTASLISSVATAITTAVKLVKLIGAMPGKLNTKKGKAVGAAIGMGLGASAYGASKLISNDDTTGDSDAYKRGYESSGKASVSSGYGSAGPMGKGVGETGSAKEAMEFFLAKGWTREQAAGIVGNLQAESGANMKTDAVGDNGRAYGVAQWHPDRQAKFKEVYGKDIRQAGFKEQLEYVNWELNNSERKAGSMLRQAKSAEEAAAIVDKYYERSSGQHIRNRQANAVALLQSGSTQMASMSGSPSASSGMNVNNLSNDVKKLQTPTPKVDVNNINNSKSQALQQKGDESIPIPSPIANRGSLGLNVKHTTAYV